MIDISRARLENLIDDWIVGYANCGRDREIIRRRLLDGVGFERLAEEFDLSVSQVKRVVYKTEERLIKHIPD